MSSKLMTVTVVDTVNPVSSLPLSIRKRAGIKAGDQLEVRASPGVVTITAKVVEHTFQPTKAELATIRKGQAEPVVNF